MKKPKLLDLFCGAGGCTNGYQRAGFWVRGVDHKPQKRYVGEEFVQADALEYLSSLIDSGEIEEFQAIHASPPCQGYSVMRFKTGKVYPMLIDATRDCLIDSKLPYVMENVEGSPIADQPLFSTHSITLCGAMFDRLRVYRHRKFESNIDLIQPSHPTHKVKCAPQGYGPSYDGQFVVVTGHCGQIDYARKAMGIDWMDGKTLAQAIPPAYCEFIGHQLLTAIQRKEESHAL